MLDSVILAKKKAMAATLFLARQLGGASASGYLDALLYQIIAALSTKPADDDILLVACFCYLIALSKKPKEAISK